MRPPPRRKTTRVLRPGDAAEGERRPPAPPKKDNTAMYVGGGVGALVLIIVLAMAAGGGGDDEQKGDGTYPKTVGKIYSRAVDEFNSGRYDAALSILAEATDNPKYRKTSRTADCSKFAVEIRERIKFEEEGRLKIEDLVKRVDKSKVDQTAMKQADAFMAECKALLATYSQISSAKKLRDLSDDLRRWCATESQSDWQNDFNIRRDRIQKEDVATGNFAQAVKRWRQFGEVSQDPIFHKKLDEEIGEVNRQAREAARALVAGGADRAALEEAMGRFVGTEGQDVINQKLKSMK